MNKRKTKDDLTSSPLSLVRSGESETAGEYKMVDIGLISLSDSNPRKSFPEDEIAELAASIMSVGIINPITVRNKVQGTGKTDPIYEIVSGERRFKAAIVAGLTEVPVIIRQLTDIQVLEVQIIENLQRKDIHPLDEAVGYQALIDKSGYSVKSLADRFGKSERFVYQRLKLNDLIEEIKKALRIDYITFGHAVLLAGLSPEMQSEVFKQIDNRKNHDEVDSVQDLKRRIAGNMMEMKKAPFNVNDAELLPAAGACTDCPKRTGFNDLLFPELNEKKIDQCTDRICWRRKIDALVNKRITEHQETGIRKKGKGKNEPVTNLVKISDQYYLDKKQENEGILITSSYRRAEGKKDKCDKMVSGIFVDGNQAGQIINICVDKNCERHSNNGRSSFERKQVNPDERYERRIEIIRQPARLQLIFDCIKTLVTGSYFPGPCINSPGVIGSYNRNIANGEVDIIQVLKIACIRFFEKLDKEQQKILLRALDVRPDTTVDNKKGKILCEKYFDSYYHFYDMVVLFIEKIEGIIEGSHCLDNYGMILLTMAVMTQLPTNAEGIMRSKEGSFFLEQINNYIDVKAIEDFRALDYNIKVKKAHDNFVKKQGREPKLKSNKMTNSKVKEVIENGE